MPAVIWVAMWVGFVFGGGIASGIYKKTPLDKNHLILQIGDKKQSENSWRQYQR